MIFVALLFLPLDALEVITIPECTSGIAEDLLNKAGTGQVLPLSATLQGMITIEIIPTEGALSLAFAVLNGTNLSDNGIYNYPEYYIDILKFEVLFDRFVVRSVGGREIELPLDPTHKDPSVAKIQISDRSVRTTIEMY